jgi:hypothetical protein
VPKRLCRRREWIERLCRSLTAVEAPVSQFEEKTESVTGGVFLLETTGCPTKRWMPGLAAFPPGVYFGQTKHNVAHKGQTIPTASALRSLPMMDHAGLRPDDRGLGGCILQVGKDQGG